MCSVTLLQQMSTGVKSHDLPGQAISPALSTQHLCSRFKSFFISKDHRTWGFHLLISHKQNPHTEINQLAVTAKIVSQPGIQLCVPSVSVQSWQTDIHGLHERLPWLFNIHVTSEHRSYLWFARDQKNIPITLWYSEPVNQPQFSNSRHCPLSACSPTVWL